MKIKKILLLVWTTMSHFIIFSQSFSIKITGTIDIAQDSDVVQAIKPVDKYFNIFYPDRNDQFFIKNKIFNGQINLVNDGFVRLDSKVLPKFVCYIELGNDITFNVKTDKSGSQVVSFEGVNAKGNDLFVNRRLLNNGMTDAAIIEKNIQDAPNAKSALEGLLNTLSHCEDTLKSLYKNNLITQKCFNALSTETEQRLLFWSQTITSSGRTNRLKLKMSRKELDILTQNLYERFDPFNEKYRSTTTSNIGDKCYLIGEKILPAITQNEKKWVKYAKQFALITNQFDTYDNAPKHIQEYLIGNDLLNALVFKPMSDEDYIKIFQDYWTSFPNSPYIPIISKHFDIEIVDKTEKKSTQPTFFSMDAQNNILFPNTLIYNSLDSLIKMQFKGQAVFIDLWATYCTPCIAEFKHEKTLHNFLDAHNIVLLYVSIDNSGVENHWMKLLKNYKLKGYHYFANETVRDKLSKIFSSIPRYMLYNEQGILIMDDANRPSSGDALHNQIKEKLNIKQR
jgi:thiol-disulfide isomerase/thioredoxin